MKWLWKVFLLLAVIFGGVFYYLTSSNGYYATKEYYVKVTTDPKIEQEKLSTGEIHTYNVYDVKAYDKDGKERDLRISSRDLFEKNQYYTIDWEDRRGVLIKKEKIDRTKIDKSVANKLDSAS
ncbi:MULTISPECIES: YxeA family protein [Bacillus cereus group]|uniref:YxeA family protein n=1 Tax=Bacillus cereus group TaxID=86661 RepID=UPI0002F78EA6|nr:MULTISPECIES: YxeA family protein [Bacillus cereus group]MBR9656183.1 DUF1093 domain-containing protein [Bacillus cereus]MCU4901235.1 YxeA family protein [Bacillus cereus]MCU5315752.1 YxeA family protein [Bacillus cereus]MCU5441711.1 YxeA family protein [Bacillus cereus]MCU5483955.1 YxeA family protein [Bacillus cereus]